MSCIFNMKGVIYCRVSSKEQVQGTSLQSQEAACREYAKQHKIEVVRVFIEQGESAKFAERTELLELLDFCRKNRGKIQALLVWKLDRFARNVTDHFNLKSALAKHGVQVLSVTEPVDSNPEGQLMETILAGFAQFDNDIRALRVTQGMRRRLQEGIFPWKPPLGYKSPAKSLPKTEPDEPDYPAFTYLQRVWDRAATGAYTKSDLRDLLSSSGITPARGGRVSLQTVDYLFRNKYYAGILTDPWNGSEYKGRHQPMVSMDTFLKVQTALNRRPTRPHQKYRLEFPLRGIVRCSTCEHPLTGSVSRGRSSSYAYYHCSQRSCRRRTRVTTGTLHGEFEDFLNGLSVTSEAWNVLKPVLVQRATERYRRAHSQARLVDQEIRKLDRQIQEVIRLRTESLINDQELLQQKADLYARRHNLEAQKGGDFMPPGEFIRLLDTAAGPLNNLRGTWKALPIGKKRRFERFMFPVGFHAGRIRTAETARFFKVFRSFSRPKSNGVDPIGEVSNRFFRELQAFLKILEAYPAGI